VEPGEHAVTAKQVAAAQRRRAALVDREFKATCRGIAISAIKFVKERLTATVYAIPEDVDENGEKLWVRTGHLRRSEKPEFPNSYTVVIVNKAPYAKARHDYGKPETHEQKAKREAKGKKEPRRFNPARVSHWHDDLEAVFRPLVPDLYRQTVEDILRRKG
jgi:hypothetical protein